MSVGGDCRWRSHFNLPLQFSQPHRQHNPSVEPGTSLCRSWHQPAKLNLKSPLLTRRSSNKVLCVPKVTLISSSKRPGLLGERGVQKACAGVQLLEEHLGTERRHPEREETLQEVGESVLCEACLRLGIPKQTAIPFIMNPCIPHSHTETHTHEHMHTYTPYWCVHTVPRSPRTHSASMTSFNEVWLLGARTCPSTRKQAGKWPASLINMTPHMAKSETLSTGREVQ